MQLCRQNPPIPSLTIPPHPAPHTPTPPPTPRRRLPPHPTAALPLQALTLADEVGDLFRSVVTLSVKLREAAAVPPDIADPRQLRELSPSGISFWVASLFAGNPYQQQQVCARFSLSAAC